MRDFIHERLEMDSSLEGALCGTDPEGLQPNGLERRNTGLAI
jgi:hypothetical protein